MPSKDKSDNVQTSFMFGILMGLADAIPGVSGGTVAFLLGFYKKLVNSLESSFSKLSNDNINT